MPISSLVGSIRPQPLSHASGTIAQPNFAL